MKLLIDMNLSRSWIGMLGSFAIQADHWSQISSPTAPDSEIMDYAAAYGYTVLTQDLDFGIMLAATGQPRPSVVQLRTAIVDPLVIGSFVVQAILASRTELEEGALLTIDPKRARVRLLPLQSPYQRPR
jgi:predicted nuclease of predicted toxin-antitoxin system